MQKRLQGGPETLEERTSLRHQGCQICLLLFRVKRAPKSTNWMEKNEQSKTAEDSIPKEKHKKARCQLFSHLQKKTTYASVINNPRQILMRLERM